MRPAGSKTSTEMARWRRFLRWAASLPARPTGRSAASTRMICSSLTRKSFSCPRAPAPSVVVGAETVVQARVVRLEVVGKPRIEPAGKLRPRAFGVRLVAVHDVADIVEQLLMRRLVLVQLVVAVLAHEALLEREMGRDGAKNLAEKGGDVRRLALGDQLLVHLVDQVDHLAVLMVDGLDADAVMGFPFDQGHGFYPFASVEDEPADVGAEIEDAVVGGLQLDRPPPLPVEFVARTVAHAQGKLVAGGGQREAAVDARGSVAGDAGGRHLGGEDRLAVDLELDGDGRAAARADLGAAHVGRHL